MSKTVWFTLFVALGLFVVGCGKKADQSSEGPAATGLPSHLIPDQGEVENHNKEAAEAAEAEKKPRGKRNTRPKNQPKKKQPRKPRGKRSTRPKNQPRKPKRKKPLRRKKLAERSRPRKRQRPRLLLKRRNKLLARS